LEKFFAGTRPSVDYDLAPTRGACLISSFIVEHNLPITAVDHMSSLIKNVCPDSKIASKLTIKRTKCTSIIKCLARDSQNEMVHILKEAPFSVATDGSSDRGEQQLYPVVVRYFDASLGRIVTGLLSVPKIKTTSTGLNIFNLLDNEISNFGLDWNNVVAFCSDNASVMMGKHKVYHHSF
jgi:hypothetical protein